MPDAIDPAKLAVREAAKPKPKRVYKTVSVAADGEIWRVLLDGKPVATPLRRPLTTPHRALAEGIAGEWDAQMQHVDPETMPLTRLLSTAIDKIAPNRAAIVSELLSYIDTELLCYRAAHPADLCRRQEAVWQPVLDWLAAKHGIALSVVQGILPVEQPVPAATRLREAVAALNDLELTAFQASAAVTSSLALSLALVHGRLSAAEVFAAAQLDETYQIEKWGEDDEAMARRRRIAADLDAIGRFLTLTRGG
jgi:chaperone required for assembly of F1-ATPase